MIGRVAQILGRIAGGFGSMTAGLFGAVGGYAATSLLGYVGNKLSPQKQLIDFNSPEFGRLMDMNVNQNLSNQASGNPLSISPYTNQRISDDTKAAMYMQGRQMNAPYDPELQRSNMLASQLQMGQMGAFGGAQNIIGGFGEIATDIANDVASQWKKRGERKRERGPGRFLRELQKTSSALGLVDASVQPNQNRPLR